MKKRFLQIATAISAATMLAACSQTDLIDDGSVKNNGTADNNAVTFSTYTAKKGGTRAGYKGNMTKDALQKSIEKGGGFGVFAYYTGTLTYGQHQRDKYKGETVDENVKGEIAEKYPNFMYNQWVQYKSDITDEEGETTGSNWTYEPLKYWPNDFASGNVDSQTPPATGSSEHGGNVSFFAYAPYVTYSAAKGDATKTGITGMTSNETEGDPKITYTIGSNVDLLWGTLDEAKNLFGNDLGVKGNKGADAGTYKKAIQNDTTVAADLTKQKVNGQIKFNFKHALAAIGGSTEAAPDGNGGGANGGFQVKLDIDDSADGSPSTSPFDGNRQKFGLDNDGNEIVGTSHYRTIVTITSVNISNTTADVTDGAKGELDPANKAGILTKSADLNLATGQWERPTNTDNSNSGNIQQTIDASTGGDGVENVTLNPVIAEIAEITSEGEVTYFTKMTSSSKADYFKIEGNTHKGVEETAQNVYAESTVSPILLIPGDRPVFKITVEYVVRQYDKALKDECTTIKNKITKDVIFPVVKMNKHYTLIMHLGLTSVKFTAKVMDWERGDAKPGNGTGEGDNTNDPVDNVEFDLPSNEPNPMNNN